MRWLTVVTTVSVALAAATPVLAETIDNDPEDYEAPPTERRGGFVFGLAGGAGFSSLRGYPNQLGEINNPDFLQTVDGFSIANSLWIGGGLRDWLTFAFVLSGSGAGEGDNNAVVQTLGIRLEAFPLYSRGGAWRDFGIVGNFGAGGALVKDADDETVADGAIMSSLGFGAFYEPWQFWQFSAGPTVDYTHHFSESLKNHTFTLGIRMAFYGAQP